MQRRSDSCWSDEECRIWYYQSINWLHVKRFGNAMHLPPVVFFIFWDNQAGRNNLQISPIPSFIRRYSSVDTILHVIVEAQLVSTKIRDFPNYSEILFITAKKVWYKRFITKIAIPPITVHFDINNM